MILSSQICLLLKRRFSRTRGGDPKLRSVVVTATLFFPHTRGWSLNPLPKIEPKEVFPAHAGVILNFQEHLDRLQGFSRTRGCDPIVNGQEMTAKVFFPHTRGWSHTHIKGIVWVLVFPAHAGVILWLTVLDPSWCSFSRTRGGDPSESSLMSISHLVFPAHAGVIPKIGRLLTLLIRFSRTRGSDPSWLVRAMRATLFSPHTRGWSCGWLCACLSRTVFPAHAGVIPSWRWIGHHCSHFSRTRGCDPIVNGQEMTAKVFFPHTRGIDYIKWDIRKISLLKTDKLEIGVFYYRKKAYFVQMKISYITKEKISKSNEVIMETFGNNKISWVTNL